jgi:two-component system, sensor histidine kinase and response regulator
MTKILIVDDLLENRYLLDVLLRSNGYETVQAENGAMALDSLRNGGVDFIISDIFMPILDGFELCRECKKDEATRSIPFVFFTATYTDLHDEGFALSLGADRFLSKPQEPEVLLGIIQDLLQAGVQEETPGPFGQEMEFFRQHNAVLFKKLEKKMLELEHEVAERKRAEAEILKLNAELEDKVVARTLDLERTNLILAGREEEIRSMVGSMGDVVITIDERGVIRSANPAVATVFGYGAEELLGKNVSLLMPEPARSAHDGHLERYRRTGEAHIIGTGREVAGLHKNGGFIPLDLAVSEFSLQGKRYFTGILRDIRERVRIMADLNQARHEAEQATHAKSAFLAAMSHEIRTPMNGVIGMIDVLHQTSLRGYQVEMVDLIRESADSLLGIIEDILDFSKIEAGRLEIERAPLRLDDVLEKTCGMLDSLAGKKGVELTLFMDPDVPETVLGDALRLRQVLINLAGNAIKFAGGQSRPGRVSVRAQLADHGPGQAWVALHVVDNGIGMDAATQAALFTPFTQADASTTRRYGGTGLGLAISRQLVNLMGGEITLQSALDEGSTFSVHLPLVWVPTRVDPDGAASRVAGLSCLVVGGPEGHAAELADCLRRAGAQVEGLPDLGAAGERVGLLPPGLCVWILDVGTAPPRPAELRAALGTRSDLDCRFVLIGRGPTRPRGRPRLEGRDLVTVDGHLLTRRAVLRAVALAAGRVGEDTEAPPPTGSGAALSPPSRAEAQRQGRLILVAEDNETNQKVLLHQLALLGVAADVAGDGREALERWNAGDYALLLTDVNMPRMDGYELCAAIRAGEGGSRRRPIIALTANALKGEAERCRAAGMDDYLTKPTPLTGLRAMLEHWLPAADPGPELPGPTRGTDPVDIRVLKALVGEDPAILGDLLRDFQASAAKTTAELKAACGAGQAALASALAHRLKSSARYVGALALGELCAEIEQAGRTGRVEDLATLWPRFEAEMGAVDQYLRSR